MAPSVALGTAHHDDLLRAVHAAGHAFAPIEDPAEEGPINAAGRLITLSAISISGFVAGCGVFLVFA